MNQKTLTKLEYDKIIGLLEEEASSFRGRQLCRRLKPMTDLNKINTFQEQTAAAFTRIIRKGRFSFGDAAPIEESMKRLEIGGDLSISEHLPSPEKRCPCQILRQARHPGGRCRLPGRLF